MIARWQALLAKVGAALAVLAIFVTMVRRNMRQEIELKQNKKEEKAREVVAKERARTRDADVRTLVERLRSRDSRWGM